MIYKLAEALRSELTEEFRTVWEMANSGEYEEINTSLFALPTRKRDEVKKASLVFIPMAGEDSDTEEKMTLDIICCTYSKDEEQGNVAVMNMVSVIKRYIRNKRTIGGIFSFTGSLSWSLLDDKTEHPEPYYFAAVRVEYETPIIITTTDTEAGIYGSKY